VGFSDPLPFFSIMPEGLLHALFAFRTALLVNGVNEVETGPLATFLALPALQ